MPIIATATHMMLPAAMIETMFHLAPMMARTKLALVTMVDTMIQLTIAERTVWQIDGGGVRRCSNDVGGVDVGIGGFLSDSRQ